MQSARHPSILDLISDIGACALQPERWATALGQVVDYMGGVSGILWSHQATPEAWGMWVPVRLHDDYLARYANYFHRTDIWMQQGYAKGLLFKGNVSTGSQIVERQAFLDSEFYRDFLKGQDIHDMIGGVLHDGKDSDMPVIHLAIFRSHAKPPYGIDDIDRLRVLVPSLQQATETNFVLAKQARQLALTSAALATLAPALILLNGEGRVVFRNDAAVQLLMRHDGLSMKDERLITSKLPDQKQLDGLLQATAEEVGLVRIAKATGSGLIIVMRLPVHPMAPNIPDVRQAKHVLIVHDPAKLSPANIDVFSVVYALTSAEARLMQCLSDGLVPKEAAADLGISLSTVRSQLASIYAKTGVSRQSDLIRLVLAMPNTRRT